MSLKIDLNADLGEGCGDDAAIMKIVTRCNIACGGHAGDAASMAEALSLAKANNAVAGAHPSYPDPENFGRTNMKLSADALSETLTCQIRELMDVAEQEGVRLAHVKPHGALYNVAAKDIGSAQIIADVTASLLPHAAVLGPPGSKLEEAACAAGLAFLGEAFADRAYEADGSLRSRALPGAVITDQRGCAAQALQIAVQNEVTTYDGHSLPIAAQTICLHGDTPGSLKTARFIRAAFEAEGIEVCADV